VAVRRGFTGSGISGKDDAEFVNNAMRWYEKEKGNLIVNENSRLRGGALPYDENDPDYRLVMQRYEKIPPLFVEKSSVPERKGK
jgi:hypothetical protein